jgi:hypothetical protein
MVVPERPGAAGVARRPSRLWDRLRGRRSAEELRLDGLRRLDDVRCVLEQARSTVSTGWIQDRWVVSSAASGAGAVHEPQACLIGAVALAVQERDVRADLTVDGGAAIDFVWDAVQESRGLRGPGVAGRAAPPEVRLARMHEVAQWNDQPGRRRDDVLAVLDLAISHVIIAAMRRPAPAHV